MRAFPVQTALVILLLGAMLAGAHMVYPSVHGLDPAEFSSLLDFSPDRAPVSPLVRHVDPVPPAPPRIPTLEDSALLQDTAPALDHFYQSLWRTEEKQPDAITRIVHYGDSPSTADLITGDVRKLLQSRYGDAGHGYILLAKPWAWYQHTGAQTGGSGWNMNRASFGEAHDGIFGLGGVSFEGSEGATSTIEYSTPGHTHFEVWYLKQPGGGTLEVNDGIRTGEIDTSADERGPGLAAFEAPAGVSKLELRVKSGTVRAFGVVAEKSGPGVVYDTIGLNGASISVLSHLMNANHLTDELRLRRPDLVIINYGTNEADFADFINRQYEKELREAIRRIRAALPDASILLMSPMDRGKHAGSEIETMATIPQLVEIQRRVAKETGCGFFDTFHAMGGEGTMARWYTGKPRLVSADLIHPFPAGGKMIAEIFARELSAGLSRYKFRMQRRGQRP